MCWPSKSKDVAKNRGWNDVGVGEAAALSRVMRLDEGVSASCGGSEPFAPRGVERGG